MLRQRQEHSGTVTNMKKAQRIRIWTSEAMHLITSRLNGLPGGARVAILVCLGLTGTIAWATGCTWGWADNNCQTSNCSGSCYNGTKVVLQTTYCQTQGAWCCQCTEIAKRCVVTGPCSTSFWYYRTRQEGGGECESGPNGLQCTL